MSDTFHIPRYNNDFPTFLTDLRWIISNSQAQIARELNMAHTTISRYEGGKLHPATGYVAYLAFLIGEHLPDAEDELQQQLLQEVNKAMPINYNARAIFADWDELCTVAKAYKAENTPDTGRKVDWGEAPNVNVVYGRKPELEYLQQITITKRARLVLIVGMAGMGKTILATRLAHNIQPDYQYVLWRSLRNAPPLEYLLNDILTQLNVPFSVNDSSSIDQQIRRLLDFMRQKRCLLVLDNLESILEGGTQIGQYSTGYEDYDDFLVTTAQAEHQSCVILTSREIVTGLEQFNPEQSASYHYQIDGLDSDSAQKLFADHALDGDPDDLDRLATIYSGNVLALKLVSNLISKFLGGNLKEFLEQGMAMFTDIRQLLDTSYERLDPLAQELLYWLVIERKAVAFTDLTARLVPRRDNGSVLDALQSLERVSLIELSELGFSVQNVISEYVIDRLIQELQAELYNEKLHILHRLALLTMDASKTIRGAQQRLIVEPIVAKLLAQIHPIEVRPKFERLIHAIRQHSYHHADYAAGNLLNIMLGSRRSIEGYDFSNLLIQHAQLENASLTRIDFTGSRFLQCIFDNTFTGINTVALSPSARYLALAANTEIHIWDLEDRQLHHILRGHQELVWDIVFVDDEGYVFSRDANVVYMWEIASSKIIRSFPQNQRITAIAVTHTGSLLAMGSYDGLVFVWAVHSGELDMILDETNGIRIRTLAFDASENYLAIGDRSGKILLWSLNPLTLHAELSEHTSGVTALTFSSVGDTLISGSMLGNIGLWDVANGTLRWMISAHSAMISGIKLGGDNRFVSSSFDKTIQIRDMNHLEPLLTLQGHNLPVSAIDTDATGKLLIGGGFDRRVLLWNTHDGYLIDTIAGLTFELRSLAFSPNSRFLAIGSADYCVYLWDWATDTRIQTYSEHTRWLSSVVFHPNGQQFASGSYDRTVRVWYTNHKTSAVVIKDDSYWVYCVDYSPDGKWLVASGEDRTIRIWETTTYTLQHTLSAHEGAVTCVIFHPQKQWLMSAGKDGQVLLWDTISGDRLATLNDLLDEIVQVGFHTVNIVVCVLQNGHVIFWDVETNQVRTMFHLPATDTLVISLSRDGQWLAHYTPHQVTVYQLSTQDRIQQFKVYGGRVTCLCFDSTSRHLASGSIDGWMNVWEARTGREGRIFKMDRPYDGMNITGVQGINETQREMLKTMGAIEDTKAQAHS